MKELVQIGKIFKMIKFFKVKNLNDQIIRIDLE